MCQCNQMEWCAAAQVMIARRRFAPNKSKSHVQTISENVYPFIYYLSSHVKAEMKVQCVQAKGKANQKFFLALWPALRNVSSWKRISRRVQVDMLMYAPSALALIISFLPKTCWKCGCWQTPQSVLRAHGKIDSTFLAAKPDRNNCIRAKLE